ncbi:uncharacterized protein [Apostichopus japonicus]|uniref:uncharacterized protein n=1 Tax=Stichopus japonicus TaxID=307972 RepID=UPI003AB2973F
MELGDRCLCLQSSCKDKSFTDRGILSTVNSLYDPLGLVAPVTLYGKVLVKELTSRRVDWDAPLSHDKEEECNQWRDSLQALQQLSVPWCYAKNSLLSTRRKELCIFADASEKAIWAVAYLRATDNEGNPHVGFVMEKSKLAPRPAHTFPRLELYAAVLAKEMFELINKEIEVKFDAVKFFTDSPKILNHMKELELFETNDFDLVEPERDAEIRPEVKILLTKVDNLQLGSQHFNVF